MTEEFLSVCPNDLEFASYLRMLESAGVTKEDMKATGLLEQIEERKKEAQKNRVLSIAFKNCLQVNAANLEMLKQIEKFENLGLKPEEIIATLGIPDVVLAQLQLGPFDLNEGKEERKK